MSIYTSIHDVAEIKITETHQQDNQHKNFVRTMMIYDVNGNKFEITLFAKDAINLIPQHTN